MCVCVCVCVCVCLCVCVITIITKTCRKSMDSKVEPYKCHG